MSKIIPVLIDVPLRKVLGAEDLAKGEGIHNLARLGEVDFKIAILGRRKGDGFFLVGRTSDGREVLPG